MVVFAASGGLLRASPRVGAGCAGFAIAVRLQGVEMRTKLSAKIGMYASSRDVVVYVSGPREENVLVDCIEKLSQECPRISPITAYFQEAALAPRGYRSFDWWLDFRLALVERSDAVFVLDGMPVYDVVFAEESRARTLNKPVFYNLCDVVSWAQSVPPR